MGFNFFIPTNQKGIFRCTRLLVFIFDDARHVFEYLFSPGFLQEILLAFYRKNILDVDLSIGSSHFYRFGEPKVEGCRKEAKALLAGFDQGKFNGMTNFSNDE